MPTVRRIGLPALLMLMLMLPAAGASAAGSCTTAIPAQPPELALDTPSATGCSAAVLQVSPNPVAPLATVTLDGSQSVGDDLGNPIVTYAWDFGDGTTDQTAQSSVTHAYARGRYTASLTILDGRGATLDTTTADLIASDPPTAALTVPPGVLRPGVSYAFDASGSTAPGGSIARYDWDWGDGTTTLDGGPTPHHTFAREAASTQVSVEVVNDLELASAPATAAVTVHDELPLVQLVATPATVQVGQQLSLDAAGTSDPDGSVVEYRWDLDSNGSFETSTGTRTSVTAGGYPNPGPIVLRVKAIDDSGGSSVKGVVVTVARPASSGGGTSTGTGGGPAARGGGSAGAGGSGGGSGAGSTGGSGGDAFAVTLGGAAIQQLAGALRRGIGLRAVANHAAGGTLTVSVSAKDAKKLRLPGRKGSRPVKVGSLRVALAAGRTVKPSIKLTAAAARALRRAKPRTLRVTIRGAIAGGGDSAAVVRVVLLRG